MFHRYNVFKSNHAYIEKHNAMKDRGFKLALNKFADLTLKEYRSMLGLKRGPRREVPSIQLHDITAPLPNSVDWVQAGAVNAVKDQGQCGSCWSFSARAAMETAWFLKSGKQTLYSLSEQLCVDCVNNGTDTCDAGGEMHDCYLEVIALGNDVTEDVYPYTATSMGVCQYPTYASQAIPTPFKGYTQVVNCTQKGSTYDCNENDLKIGAANTVISVGIDASQQSFQFYSSGVYNEPACLSCDQLDHGVAVVGYGTESGQDYWLVRNSWGADWGLQGYIKMSRNKNNQCGIACDATFPY
jgi:cathepsin L